MAFTPVERTISSRGTAVGRSITITASRNAATPVWYIRLSKQVLEEANAALGGPLRYVEIFQDADNLRMMLALKGANTPNAWKINYEGTAQSTGLIRVPVAVLDPKIEGALRKRKRRMVPFDITTQDNNLNNRIFLEINSDAMDED